MARSILISEETARDLQSKRGDLLKMVFGITPYTRPIVKWEYSERAFAAMFLIGFVIGKNPDSVVMVLRSYREKHVSKVYDALINESEAVYDNYSKQLEEFIEGDMKKLTEGMETISMITVGNIIMDNNEFENEHDIFYMWFTVGMMCANIKNNV